VHGKMTSDISITGAVPPVPLDLSTAISGLSQDTNSGDIRGAVTDPTAGRDCRGDRRARKYGNDALRGVGNQFGGSLRPCPNGLADRARVGS
jgi:hypothetical protein